MTNKSSLLKSAKNVGNSLRQSYAEFKERNLGKVVLDPGVLFSAYHAIAFSDSPSPVVQSLGIASLALTTSVAALRNLKPEWNNNIAKRFNSVAESLKAPKIDSAGFPLFINGVVLTSVVATSIYLSDFRSAAISLGFAVSNIDKGSRISGSSWTLESLGNKLFNRIGRNDLVDNPPRALKYSVYLPEAWAATAAAVVAFTNPEVLQAIKDLSFNASVVATMIGGVLASVGVVAAGINNGDNVNPAVRDNKFVKHITDLSDHLENPGENPASDAVKSRRFVKYGGGSYTVAAIVSLDPVFAAAQSATVLANTTLEKGDRLRQQQALGLA